MSNIANIWIWIGFSIFIVIALAIDTFVLDKKVAQPNESIRAALFWSCVWIASALIFNCLLWVYLYAHDSLQIANEKALSFFTGYLIEKTLSIDNLFVFFIIFHQFNIPSRAQPRVFAYGIWSAIVFRLLLILLGTWLVVDFHWILYVMGFFLLLTGIKMFFTDSEARDFKNSKIYLFLKDHVRLTHEIQGSKLFIKKNGHFYATPLFVSLIFIEISDLIFAFDSIPAIFGITTDPFIVWTSNIFAILGLRALYFILAGMIPRFHLLKYGIALILIFVGAKMMIEPWIHITVGISLSVIIGILVFFTYLSIYYQRKYKRKVG